MINVEMVLKKIKKKISETPSLDKRKLRGKNLYSVVISQHFSSIIDLLSDGISILGIFELLQNEEVFEATAEYRHFHRAFQREQARRGVRIIKDGGDGKNKPGKNPTASSVSSASSNSAIVPVSQSGRKLTMKQEHEDGDIYVKEDGKEYGWWKGKEIYIPNGKKFINGALLDDESYVPNKKDVVLESSEYPQHIRDFIAKSARDGKSLANAPVVDRMIDEWKANGRNVEKIG